jgi:cell division protein FtsW
MSGMVVIVLIGVVMLFVAGAKISHLTMIGLPAVVCGVILILTSEYRFKRVTAFIDPFKDKLGEGWQSIQSLYAIGSGGLFGLGLGRSRQKFLYIPEPHNDFIFAILCEELGLIGALVAILLFVLLIYKGITIALNAPDTFSCLVATGIMTLIAVEVIINIAVVTSSMPVTGMPLPFFSYGGTALLMHMIAMGIMLNISRYSNKKG